MGIFLEVFALFVLDGRFPMVMRVAISSRFVFLVVVVYFLNYLLVTVYFPES
jgi:hypothetical protein